LQNENKWKHHQDVCFLRESKWDKLAKIRYHNNFWGIDIYRIIGITTHKNRKAGPLMNLPSSKEVNSG
jgi:hypothetical protein